MSKQPQNIKTVITSQVPETLAGITDLRQGVVELVKNPLGRITTANTVVPIIRVDFLKRGEHPLFRDVPILMVTDNGMGFTDEVVNDYCMLALSGHVGSGVHGTGRLFAAKLNKERRWTIITAIEETGLAFRLDMSFQDVANGTTVCWDPLSRSGLPFIPQRGTFSQIIIPNWLEDSFTEAQLIEYLTKLLPYRSKWDVRVNGKTVPHRVLKTSIRKEWTNLPEIGEAFVELGLAEDDSMAEPLQLIDSKTMAPVVDFVDIPAAQRRRMGLHPNLLYPRLIGVVGIRGMEAFSMPSRQGLQETIFTTKKGRAACAFFGSWVADLVGELIAAEPTKLNDSIIGGLREVASKFSAIFGAPKLSPTEIKAIGGAGLPIKTSSGSGGKKTPPLPKTPGDDSVRREPKVPRGIVFLPIEGRVYQLLPHPMTSTEPAILRPGDVIEINTAHHEISGTDGRLLQRTLMHAILEAHVISGLGVGTSAEAIKKIYVLSELLLKKKADKKIEK